MNLLSTVMIYVSVRKYKAAALVFFPIPKGLMNLQCILTTINSVLSRVFCLLKSYWENKNLQTEVALNSLPHLFLYNFQKCPRLKSPPPKLWELPSYKMKLYDLTERNF